MKTLFEIEWSDERCPDLINESTIADCLTTESHVQKGIVTIKAIQHPTVGEVPCSFYDKGFEALCIQCDNTFCRGKQDRRGKES